jgi:hypothetical protein
MEVASHIADLNMAHGAGPAFVVVGTLDQQDQNGLLAAKPVFEWHKQHSELYVGQESAARVLLLSSRQQSYRGFFRILSEQHIPFAVSDNFAWLADRTRAFDLIISSNGLPHELEGYLREGGRVLAAGAAQPRIEIGKVVKQWKDTRSAYFRIHDKALFPSLKNTQLLFVDGDYLEFEPLEKPLLTLIPPSMFGPPENSMWTRWKPASPASLSRSTAREGSLTSRGMWAGFITGTALLAMRDL